MATSYNTWTLRIEGTAYALSMRRIYEHVVYRQVWPFPADIDGTRDPTAVIDVVRLELGQEYLAGFTLAELQGEDSPDVMRRSLTECLAKTPTLQTWIDGVRGRLQERRARRGLRNRPERFLPTDTDAPFRLLSLRSALLDWLHAHRNDVMPPAQWAGRLRNLPGLRRDEVEWLRLDDLLAAFPKSARIRGNELLAGIDARSLRLSVIPVTVQGNAQLDLRPVDSIYWPRLPRARSRRLKQVVEVLRDPFLGYSMERRCWDDLFGAMEIWMIYDHRGELIRTRAAPRGHFLSRDQALKAAQRHAGEIYPKLSTMGRWSHHRLTGGARYREWLVTLPWFAASYFTSHFPHRNILLHVRGDLREGLQGERVLFLQEIQSDWAQTARRNLKDGDASTLVPPWLDEWPALALKLMLMHAVDQGFEAIAWTTGREQAKRWDKLGERGLRELYDRTIPREASRLLKPLGAAVTDIAFYRPMNFAIEPTDDGYVVLDAGGEVAAECKQWSEVAAAIPCGAVEDALTMPGIRIDAALKSAIAKHGLHAWGNALGW
ncbi:MAG: hypothetical protein IPP28_00395 [Xanthomonadales bacterium]|nr:hypothetical protein [Xanthomonadales bacterium]